MSRSTRIPFLTHFDECIWIQLASFVILCISFCAFNLKIILKRKHSLHQMLRRSHGTDGDTTPRQGTSRAGEEGLDLAPEEGQDEGTPAARTGKEVRVGWEENRVKAEAGRFPGT